MRIMFRAAHFSIEEIEVSEYATEHFLTLASGRRVARDTSWSWIRDTREEAKQAMIKSYSGEVADAVEHLENCRSRLAKALEA